MSDERRRESRRTSNSEPGFGWHDEYRGHAIQRRITSETKFRLGKRSLALPRPIFRRRVPSVKREAWLEAETSVGKAVAGKRSGKLRDGHSVPSGETATGLKNESDSHGGTETQRFVVAPPHRMGVSSSALLCDSVTLCEFPDRLGSLTECRSVLDHRSLRCTTKWKSLVSSSLRPLMPS